MSNRIQLNTTVSDHHFIEVGFNIFEEISEYLRSTFSCKKGVLIIDENVFELYKNSYLAKLISIFDEHIICIVPSGESSKSLDQFQKISNRILESGVERATPVIVVGGGVTGDLGGFVAASCLRGMSLIHVPTTLLAMVDSSIGGKTGINHEVGKNLIGAFYHPKAVFADLLFLETLPEKEIINGLGEVIKYGMIRDKTILTDLKEISFTEKFSYSKRWEQIIETCAKIKVDIVSEDFKESGVREILNFGHTFAHVIERIGEYRKYSHGEAVFMGMWGAVKLSNLLGFDIDIANLSTFKPLYTSRFNPNESLKELTSLMLFDKKVMDGTIKAIILEKEEKAKSTVITDKSVIQESWKFIIQEFK
ncbi:MAG: 3-dehydroquinate synthase [Balneola sp.]